MKVFIFMNHQIRRRRPTAPVIRCLSADGTKQDGDMVVINGPSIVRFDPRGLPLAKDHEVRAWIEADLSDIVIT